jgi:Nif-specific regulatory protein
MDYDWPGNVRELANAIERAVVLGQDDLIRPEDLPEAILESRTGHGGPLTTYHEALNATKRRLIVDAFREAGGNYTHAAHRLGLHPNYLHRLIRNLGLKAELEAG